MDTAYKVTIPPTSYEVYHWPEFIAFADRLGIPIHLRNIGLVIEMPLDGLVKITHTIQGEDRSTIKPDTVCGQPVDTTNQNNKNWRTFRPGRTIEADKNELSHG